MVRKKTIIIGVTGSIACYKTIDIVKQLKKEDNDVHVIMTLSATALVDPKDFEKASSNPVHTHLFHPTINFKAYLKNNKPMEHISLADKADLILVCPASANILAKAANGIADDLLTTTILATSAPVVFAPAMNVKMWKNPATQANVGTLKKYSYYFVDPEYGDLACGYKGVGRLAGGEKIVQMVNDLLQKRNQLSGKKIIVTAGATEEFLDAVRILTNRASGKMGAAIADEAFLRGAEVILIRGRHAVSPRYHFKEIIVDTSDDMLLAIEQEMNNTDIFFHTAAVSDFSLNKPLEEKVKSDHDWHLTLAPKGKILNQLKKLNPKTILIGFKAEHNVSKNQLVKKAYEILKSSHADFVVANDVGKKERGFASDTNEVEIIDKKKKVKHVSLSSKQHIASQVIEYVINQTV